MKAPEIIQPVSAASEWPKVYSDHAALRSEITPGGPQILTWNIMTHCREASPPSPTNNAYNKSEELSDYQARLGAIADKIKQEIVKQDSKLGVITLQEVPDDAALRKLFLDKIGIKSDDWQAVYKKSAGGNFGVLTLINKSKLEFNTSPQGSDNSVITDFTIKGSPEKKVRVINSHFPYKKDKTAEQFKNELATLFTPPDVSPTAQVIIAGDFNADVSKLRDKERCFCLPNTSAYFDAGETKTHSVDGFLFKENPATYDFKKATTPDKAVIETEEAFTKQISLSKLLTTFSTKGYDVSSTKDKSSVVIESKDKKSSVEIKKGFNDKLEIISKNTSPDSFNIMIEAAHACLPAKTKLNIEISGGDKTNPEYAKTVNDLKNNLWLQAVKGGFTVGNHKPAPEFILAHQDELPEELRPAASPRPTP